MTPYTWKIIAAGALVSMAGLALWAWLADPAEGPSNAAQAVNASGAAGSGKQQPTGGSTAPFSAEGMASKEAQIALWAGRYDRAEKSYTSYKDATRYPPDSQPIAGHPDQIKPFDPVAEDMAMRDAQGRPIEGVILRTTQERVFASGLETIRMTVAAVGAGGEALDAQVRPGVARSLPSSKTLSQVISASVPFADDGTAGDANARDKVHTAQLNPAAIGFANYAGTIRVLVDVAVNGKIGVAHFDVIYSPDVPAVWVGGGAGVREAVEAGSLNFYLKAKVLKPGRYVVSARVDDANGTPFALLQFNDEVTAGPREFKLTVFGALIIDKHPAFPLRLRDVDGFLLYPDTFPDRVMMARSMGVVHVSGRYGLERFSPDEWTSEERTRYLDEYGNDLDKAKRELDKLRR